MEKMLYAFFAITLLGSACAQNGGESEDNPVKMKSTQTVADYIAEWNEELGLTNYTEGDIAPEMEPGPDDHVRRRRAAIRNRNRLWPGGIVPYTLHYSASRYAATRNAIYQAINEFNARTCIRFIPRTNQRNGIIFYGRYYSGCWSYVGRQYSLQTISIGFGCETKGIVIHEILHALGFYHEQSRPDRDLYIRIHTQNIASGRQHNFVKQSSTTVDSLGAVYDYDGLMHYGSHAFSRNGRPTITAIRPNYTSSIYVPPVRFGQRLGFSTTDLIQLWALYRCSRNNTIWSQWSTWAPCDLSCQSKRQRYCHRRDRNLCPGANQHFIQVEGRVCSPHCVVHGEWSSWSSWSNCSSSCEDGVRTRQRTCTNPAPVNGGRPCLGKATETGHCWSGFCNPTPDDCDFEDSKRPYCHWKNIGRLWFYRFSLQAGWNLDGDHTKNGAGWYVRFFGNQYRYYPRIGRLSSKTFPATPQRTIKFFYNMYGTAVTYLRVLIKDAQREREVWRRTGRNNRRWLKAVIPISNPREYTVIFESKAGITRNDDVALDDIHFVEGGEIENWSGWSTWSACDTRCEMKRTRSCLSYDNHRGCEGADLNGIQTEVQRCSSCLVNCDFDEFAKPFCHWNGTSYPHFKRHRLASPSAQSGPTTDKSKSGRGFYLLADSAQFPYNIIQTKSRQFPKTRGTRLTFYYFMYGQTVKELSVFIQYGKVSKEIWKASGNQGRKWNKADVVYYSPASYNILFQANMGLRYTSDIAIDNISFEEVSAPSIGWSVWSSWGPCNQATCQQIRERYCFDQENAKVHCPGAINGTSFNSTAGYMEIQKRECKTGRRCTDDCTFDDYYNQYCHWQPYYPSRTRFYRRSGPTPTFGTGPNGGYDPTNATNATSGSYLYLEATYLTYGDTAVLRSKQFPATTTSRQMVFYYNMYGSAVNQLRIMKQVNLTRTQLWQLHGNQGSRWIRGSVDVSGNEPYRLLFEASAGHTYQSDIAIDHVKFISEETNTTSWSEWTKWSKCDEYCIQRRQRNCIAKSGYSCNGIETEERHCTEDECLGNCDFENPLLPFCSWENVPGNLQFVRVTGMQNKSDDSGDRDRHGRGHGGRHGRGHGRGHDKGRGQGHRDKRGIGYGHHSWSRGLGMDANNNETGHYILMDSSYAVYGAWARLRSKLFSPTDHAELQFNYYMHGASVNALKIYIVVNGFKNLLFAITGDQGDAWHTQHLPISSQYPYRIMFEALAGMDYRADIAIDDISMHFEDVDGHWSEWSPWSACSSGCTQMRTRQCTEPRRQGAGADCVGEKQQFKNCSGGQCFSGCGGTLSASNGTLTTPNYPEHYFNNLNCVWTITVPFGYVSVEFLDFELESHPYCSDYDFVEIRSGNQRVNLCGINGQGYMSNFNTSVITVTLRTDGSVTRKGFKMMWQNHIMTTQPPTTTRRTTTLPRTTRPPNTCGGSYNGLRGSFASPNYPANYNNRHNCIWTITVPAGQRVQLRFIHFNLENNFDFLTIREGSASGRIIQRLTSNQGLGNNYDTVSNVMYLRFTTDGSVTRSGFHAFWLAIQGIVPTPTPSTPRPSILASSAAITNSTRI